MDGRGPDVRIVGPPARFPNGFPPPNRPTTVSLDALTRIIVHRAWLPLVLAAAGGVAGFGYARSQTPVFEAESRVSIQAARPADLGQTQAINSLLRSFAADVVTREMAEEVAAQIPESAAADLRGSASAAADEGSREVRIHVRSRDAAYAEKVADVWASVFVARRDTANLQLDQRERVFAGLRDATTHRQYSPRTKLLAAMGTAVGMAAGLALALVAEFGAAGTIRSSEDAAAFGSAGVLGSVAAPTAVGMAPAGAGVRAFAGRWAPAAMSVMGLAALGAAVAVGAASLRPEVFRARTRIAVEPARTSDWGQTQAIREIMRGYSEDISTRRMAGETARRLELDLPPSKLIEGLRVAPHEDTYEIWLDYRGYDPDTARSVSRTWAEVFTEERITANQDLDAVDRIYARLRDETPVESAGGRRATTALAGAVIGALAGAALVLAAALSRKRRVAASDWDDVSPVDPPALGWVPPPRQGAAE